MSTVNWILVTFEFHATFRAFLWLDKKEGDHVEANFCRTNKTKSADRNHKSTLVNRTRICLIDVTCVFERWVWMNKSEEMTAGLKGDETARKMIMIIFRVAPFGWLLLLLLNRDKWFLHYLYCRFSKLLFFPYGIMVIIASLYCNCSSVSFVAICLTTLLLPASRLAGESNSPNAECILHSTYR